MCILSVHYPYYLFVYLLVLPSLFTSSISSCFYSCFYYRHSPAKLKHWSLVWPDLEASKVLSSTRKKNNLSEPIQSTRYAFHRTKLVLGVHANTAILPFCLWPNIFICVHQLLISLVAALGDSASCWPMQMLVYSLVFCFSIEILPTVLPLDNTFTVSYIST